MENVTVQSLFRNWNASRNHHTMLNQFSTKLIISLLICLTYESLLYLSVTYNYPALPNIFQQKMRFWKLRLDTCKFFCFWKLRLETCEFFCSLDGGVIAFSNRKWVEITRFWKLRLGNCEFFGSQKYFGDQKNDFLGTPNDQNLGSFSTARWAL